MKGTVRTITAAAMTNMAFIWVFLSSFTIFCTSDTYDCTRWSRLWLQIMRDTIILSCPLSHSSLGLRMEYQFLEQPQYPSRAAAGSIYIYALEQSHPRR